MCMGGSALSMSLSPSPLSLTPFRCCGVGRERGWPFPVLPHRVFVPMVGGPTVTASTVGLLHGAAARSVACASSLVARNVTRRAASLACEWSSMHSLATSSMYTVPSSRVVHVLRGGGRVAWVRGTERAGRCMVCVSVPLEALAWWGCADGGRCWPPPPCPGVPRVALLRPPPPSMAEVLHASLTAAAVTGTAAARASGKQPLRLQDAVCVDVCGCPGSCPAVNMAGFGVFGVIGG